MINLIKLVVTKAADKVAERISDRDIVRKLAEYINASEVAEQFDTDEIAGHVDLYDLASNIDTDELASHIDMDELAEKVAVRMPETTPALPPDAVSDPSLTERLLEKAAAMLLERAEEAAKNGDI